MNKRSLIRGTGLSLFLLLWMTSGVSAQSTGTLTGHVWDATTDAPVVGANVVVQETVLGTSVATDGVFEISGIQPGTYTVVISHIGYQVVEQRVVVVADETVRLEIRLHPTTLDLPEAVVVRAERPYSAASSRAIRQFDLQVRPNRSAQDILQLVPGLVIAQHAGGGKAEQIFMRGFDADHGTDVAIFADGIPVNMVSHGHGQGYADLHFLIPEIVESVEVFKGPYFAQFGNLATAGAVTLKTKDHLDENLVRLEGGAFNTVKLTTAAQIPTSGAHQGAYFAGQFYNTNGPVESPQNFQRFNIFGKVHTHLNEASRIALSLGAFSSGWDASGQIPQRAVNQGLISRFGTLDDLEGGTTSRQNLNVNYTTTTSDAEFLVQAYASRYTFKLFSNFTFFLDDPVQGDMIEQTDHRTLVGLNSEYRFRRDLQGIVAHTTAGGGFRSDDAAVALWKSPHRIREVQHVDADIFERNLYLWLQQEFVFNPMWRLQLGLRGDYFTFDVEDHLDTRPADATDLPHASGSHQQSIISPKANLVFSPSTHTDLYLNVGSGFHSNDARNVVIAERIKDLETALRQQGLSATEVEQALLARNFDPAQRGIETLPRALGGELGVRTHLSKDVVVSLAAWGVQLEEELVFVGDAGTTEISGATQRIGLDLEGRVQLLAWLWADVDVSLSEGRFVDEPDGEDHVPLAPRLTSTGGVTVKNPRGVEGSLRYRHIGDRPANEDNTVTAEGYTLVNLNVGYRMGDVKLFVTVENLLDTAWNEAQFDTESRLQGELGAVSEIHFTPGNPRNVQLGVSYRF